MNFSRIIASLATLLVAPLLILGGTTSASQAAPGPVIGTSHRIEPGVGMVTAGIPCTANFIFTDARKNMYVGYAARCAAKRAAARTNGCEGATLPLGTRVRFTTATAKGRTVGYGKLAYSSWAAMKRAEVVDSRCRTNDFALVRVNRRDLGRISPTVPQWGGPVALAAMPKEGMQVFGYAGAVGRAGAFEPALEPRMGPVLRSSLWSSTVAAPATSGRHESGSGYLDSHGRAVGVFSVRRSDGTAGAGVIGSLSRQVSFARSHGVRGLKLVRGQAYGASAVL